MAYRIWVLARDTQKNLTLEDVQKKVKTQEDATKYLADLGRIAGLDAYEKKNGDD